MSISTLAELRRASPDDPRVVDLILPEVGGGKATLTDLAAIEQNPSATALRVSGLDQRTFETLIERYGQQFTAISFWKCPRVHDLAAIGDLDNLVVLAYFWNQRATSLWDLSRTPKLKGLEFRDFNKLRRLDEVAAASSLEELTFGDAVWPNMSVESLEPISVLKRLRRLSLSPKRIDDGRVQPVGALSRLEHLECPTNLFTTEQLAWLRARLPDAEGRALAPVIRLDSPVPREDGRPPLDVLVVGKRKPFLNSSADEARIERYIEQFEELVQRFRDNPTLEPST